MLHVLIKILYYRKSMYNYTQKKYMIKAMKKNLFSQEIFLIGLEFFIIIIIQWDWIKYWVYQKWVYLQEKKC